MEFDLALATRESQDNPVYYVQYAHARICSILRQAAEKAIKADIGQSGLLVEPEEQKLLKTLSTFPAAVEGSALELAPHKLIFYLMELAGQWHSYYNKHKVVGDDPALSGARLALVETLKVTLSNGLTMVGLSAPEKM